MKKLLLIHPAAKTEHSGFGDIKSWGMPPLNLCYVAALTSENWEIKIVDEYVEKLNQDEKPDLVGITAYSSNISRAYELSKEFKKKKIPTVLGGIHASLMPEEAMEYFDTVVVGEAESIWKKVISDFETGKIKKKYIGERLPLSNLPLPRRDLLSDNYQIDVVQTTRGCPFNCEFCSVTTMNGGKYRHRPIEDILDELEQIKKKILYFVDDNIFGVSKEHQKRALELFKGMIDRKIKKYWMTQTSINIAENEIVLKYAYKAGCRSLLLGIESPRDAVLKEMNKGINLKQGLEGFKKVISTIHKHGIGVIGAFIVGNDNDDLGIFNELLKFIHDTKIDVAIITLLTPLPGTKLFDRLTKENRIIYNSYPTDWVRYTFDQLVHKPKNMTVDQLVRGFDYVSNKAIASRFVITKGFLKTLFYTKNIISAILAYNFNKDNRPTIIEQQNLYKMKIKKKK